MWRSAGWRVAGAVLLCVAAAGSATVVATADPDTNVRVVRLGGAYLGVSLEDVDKEDVGRLKIAEERGAVVSRVEEDSPAAKAGIKESDVILRYQGENVHSVAQLVRLVRETPPGRTVSLEVSRDGSSQRLSATLAGNKTGSFRFGDFDFDFPAFKRSFEHELPDLPKRLVQRDVHVVPNIKVKPGSPAIGLLVGPRRLGIEYVDVTGQLARFFKVDGEGGVLVSSVEDDGPAAKAGLKVGDVIVKLGGKRVEDGDDLRRELARSDAGGEVTLTVYREGRAQDLKVTLGGVRARTRRSGEST